MTEISTKTLEAWSAAAHHIDDLGMTPIVPLEVLRSMWQHGDRELSERIAANGGGA